MPRAELRPGKTHGFGDALPTNISGILPIPCAPSIYGAIQSPTVAQHWLAHDLSPQRRGPRSSTFAPTINRNARHCCSQACPRAVRCTAPVRPPFLNALPSSSANGIPNLMLTTPHPASPHSPTPYPNPGLATIR